MKSIRPATLFSDNPDLFAAIKGTVTDMQGNPLSGVSIIIEGSTKVPVQMQMESLLLMLISAIN